MSGRKQEIGTRQANCWPFLSIRKDAPPRETSSSTSPGRLRSAIIVSDLNSTNIAFSGRSKRQTIDVFAETPRTWPATSLIAELQK